MERLSKAKLALVVEEVEGDDGGDGHGNGHRPDASLDDTRRISI